MKTLGLDISLTGTGMVVYKHGRNHDVFGEILDQKRVGYKISSQATVRDRVRRILSICAEVVTMHHKHNPDYVVIEGPSHGSRFSRHFDIGGLHYNVYAQLHLKLGVEPLVLPPKSARKKAFGMGAPPKDYPGKKGTPRTKRWVKDMLIERVDEALVPKNQDLRDALVLCLAQQGWSA